MLVRWRNPFQEMVRLQDEVNKLFSDFGGVEKEDGSLIKGEWIPAVDIHEDNEKITLKADLPGLKKDQINIKVENNVLTINGERKEEKEEKKDGYIRTERVYGSFVRSFTLPQTVDSEKIEANYKDGVLILHVPKKPEAKPKQIEVNIK